jgi:diguanylate cyclase (GGDEF)-like protein
MRRLSDTGTSADSAPTGLDEAGRQAASDVAWAALTLLGCDIVEVYVLDELAGDYIPGAVAATGEAPAPGRSIVAEDLTAVLSFGRVSVTVPDASALAGPLGAAAMRLQASSLLALRLDRGRRSLGFALCAYHESQTFDAATDIAAAAVVRLAATSLDFARRTSQALDRADRLATLLDSAAAFAGELDLESLFATIHVQIRRLMDAPAFFVAVAAGDSGELRTEYAMDCGRRLPIEAPPPIGGAALDVFRTGKPLIIESGPNSRGGPSPASNEPIELRKESALVVPMKLRDRIIGVMSVQSPRRDAYAAEHIQMLLEVAEHAATAIQNAGIFREERRRTEELTVLHRLAMLTSSESDLERVMSAIVAEAAVVFHADAASVALEDELGQFQAVADFGLSADFCARRTIDGAALRLLFGDPPIDRFFSAERFDAIGQGELLAAEGIASVSLAPLVYRGQLVGCLALYGRERSVRLSPGELRLAQLFADQATAALQRARAARALRERIDDYAFLARVSRALVSRLDVDYASILSLLREQFGYHYLSIFALEGEQQTLVLKAQLGYSSDGVDKAPSAVGQGIVGVVAQSGAMAYVPDVTRDKRYIAGAGDIRSLLAYPLTFGDQVLGALSVESPQTDGFSSRDRRVVAAFADQCAIALSNAKQYSTATDRLAALDAAKAELERHSQHLERRHDELKLINSVSAAASGTLDLDRLLQTAVRSIAKGLHVERVAVDILSDDQSRLEIAAEYRTDGVPVTVGAKLPVRRRSALADVIFERRAVASDDLANDPLMHDYRDWIVERRLQSGAFLPLVVEGRVIGMLAVNATSARRAFSSEELSVFETVANQIAIGIRNARLYGRAKDRANEDSLTGLSNHRYLQERLDHEIARAERAGHPLAIVLLDLNNFKSFNDNFGHQAGDEVLRFVANAVTSCLRTTDIAGRYGGDEFLVILPQADDGGARLLLSRLRRKVEQRNDSGFPPIPIEMSAGIAIYPREGDNKADLVAAADRAMYADKKRGFPAATPAR